MGVLVVLERVELVKAGGGQGVLSERVGWGLARG